MTSLIQEMTQRFQLVFPAMSSEEIGSAVIKELEYVILPSTLSALKLPKETSPLQLRKKQLRMERVPLKSRSKEKDKIEHLKSRNEQIRQLHWVKSQLGHPECDSPFGYSFPLNSDSSSVQTTELNKHISDSFEAFKKDTVNPNLEYFSPPDEKKTTQDDFSLPKNFENDITLDNHSLEKKGQSLDSDTSRLILQAFTYLKVLKPDEEITSFFIGNLLLLENIVFSFSQIRKHLEKWNSSTEIKMIISGIFEITIKLDFENTKDYYRIVDQAHRILTESGVSSLISFSFSNINPLFDPFVYLIENPIENSTLTSKKYRNIVD